MQFLDYIRGIRRGKDAHRIEYDAMSDPFLADAIEGYDSVEGKHADNIARMQESVSTRTDSRKKRSNIWLTTVAALVLIFVVGGYYAVIKNNQSLIMIGERVSVPLPSTYAQIKKNTPSDLAYDHDKELANRKLNDNSVFSQKKNTTVEAAVGRMAYDQESDSKINESLVASQALLATTDVLPDSVSEHAPILVDDRTYGKVRSKKSDTVYSFISSPMPVINNIDTSSEFYSDKKSTEKSMYMANRLSAMADKVCSEVVSIPQPVIGYEKYNEYLKNSVIRPASGKCANKTGIVIVAFEVSKNGRPQNLEILKSLCAEADKEAIRLIEAGSDWISGSEIVKVEVHF